MTAERARSEALEYLVVLLKEEKIDPGARAQMAMAILEATRPVLEPEGGRLEVK